MARLALLLAALLLAGTCPAWAAGSGDDDRDASWHVRDDPALTAGRATFRYDTFGDEAFWGDTLKLHQAIAGAGFGGVVRA